MIMCTFGNRLLWTYYSYPSSCPRSSFAKTRSLGSPKARKGLMLLSKHLYYCILNQLEHYHKNNSGFHSYSYTPLRKGRWTVRSVQPHIGDKHIWTCGIEQEECYGCWGQQEMRQLNILRNKPKHIKRYGLFWTIVSTKLGTPDSDLKYDDFTEQDWIASSKRRMRRTTHAGTCLPDSEQTPAKQISKKQCDPHIDRVVCWNTFYFFFFWHATHSIHGKQSKSYNFLYFFCLSIVNNTSQLL